MSHVFRKAEAKDADWLKKVFPHWKNVEKKLAQRNRQRFVAELNGKVVGHIAVRFHGKPRQHVAELESLGVLPEFRRKGIATALEEFAIRQLPNSIKLVVGNVAANNSASIALQKKLGFRQYGLLKNGTSDGKKMVDMVLMAKELSD